MTKKVSEGADKLFRSIAKPKIVSPRKTSTSLGLYLLREEAFERTMDSCVIPTCEGCA